MLDFLVDKNRNRMHRSADDVIAKYIEKGMDAFQTVIMKKKGTKYSVYPIWEHFRKHPSFRPKLLAIAEVQNDPRKDSFVLEYSN